MLVHGGCLPGLTALGGPALAWDEVLSPESENSSKFQSCVIVNKPAVVHTAGKAMPVQSSSVGQLLAVRAIDLVVTQCRTYEGRCPCGLT